LVQPPPGLEDERLIAIAGLQIVLDVAFKAYLFMSFVDFQGFV